MGGVADPNIAPIQPYRRWLWTDDDELEAQGKKLFDEKKDAKSQIVAWMKQFEAQNGREPTKQEREKGVSCLVVWFVFLLL